MVRRSVTWSLLASLLIAVTWLLRPVAAPENSPPETVAFRAPSAAAASKTPHLKPIEHVQLGERVLGRNPLLDKSDLALAEPEPATWRKLTLRAPKRDGGRLDIELLRPVSWIEEHRIRPGSIVKLDLIELGAAGEAKVLSIDRCPPIQSGPGQVVTGRFAHSSAEIVELRTGASDESIGTTAGHLFWSEDRQQFIPAADLHIGERLRRAAGQTVHLTDITRRGPPAPVFNLEIHGEHVYHVGRPGVLVHNNGSISNYGTVYRVPGHATRSGKPYIGRHNKPNPQKTRRSNDGRDRSQAEVIDTYDLNKPLQGRVKEEMHILDDGLDNLDNIRHGISPSNWEALRNAVLGSDGKWH